MTSSSIAENLLINSIKKYLFLKKCLEFFFEFHIGRKTGFDTVGEKLWLQHRSVLIEDSDHLKQQENSPVYGGLQCQWSVSPHADLPQPRAKQSEGFTNRTSNN
jgi:hypothetical protein